MKGHKRRRRFLQKQAGRKSRKTLEETMRSHPCLDGAMPFVKQCFAGKDTCNAAAMCSLRCVKQPPEGCMALAHSEMLNLQDHNTYANLDMHTWLHKSHGLIGVLGIRRSKLSQAFELSNRAHKSSLVGAQSWGACLPFLHRRWTLRFCKIRHALWNAG